MFSTWAMHVWFKEQTVFSCANVSPCTVICAIIYRQQARNKCVFVKQHLNLESLCFPCLTVLEPSLPINLHFNEVFFQGTSSAWIL